MNSSTIGDHVELQRGTTYKSALLEQPGPMLLGLGSIERNGGFRSNKLKTYGGSSPSKLLVYPGDLYVSLKDVTQSGDLLGSIARVPDTVTVGRMTQDTVKLCVKTAIHRGYFYWLLRTPQYRQHCRSHATGTTNLGLSRDDFFAFEIPKLTSTREKLTDILEGIEQKIIVNRQTNQTLEEMAKAIYKSWFVDFEPVKAKIEAKENGQDPERAAMCVISGKVNDELDQLTPDQFEGLTAIAAIFPDELVESELGLVPNGWKVKSIKDWGEVICGKTPPKKDPSCYEGLVPFIKIPDMHGNVFVTTTNDTLSQKGASTQPKKQVPKGSVCVSCIATVGQVVIASEDSHTNQQINTVVPSEMSHSYYLFFSMMDRTRLLHDLASGGSATLNLNTGNFSKIPLLFPGNLLLEEYNQKVDSNFMSILLNDRQSQVLTGLRDTLLPKLISGEIDPPENTQSS